MAFVLGISGCTAHQPSGAHSVILVCNGSTVRCPDAVHYASVQSAVNAADPGDWILIWPGVYHEYDAAYHAGIWITTPDLHIRGLSRTGVIIDGSHGHAGTPCPSTPATQNLTARNGIVVWKTNGVTIQNLTVCDYLSGPGGEGGNEIWWDGGDASGRIGMHGFEGSYLTATSAYGSGKISDSHLAQYGIYVGNTSGPGRIVDSYASNMAAGAFYVGACRQACDTMLSGDHGTGSAFGYLGTNAGGRLVIKDSVFDHNRTGMAPSSLNNDDGPPPQNGRCPGSSTKLCTLIENNKVNYNNNASAPTVGSGPSLGIGIDLDGAQFDIVSDNSIIGNDSWGIIANDTVGALNEFPYSRCQGGYANMPAKGLCLLPAHGSMIFGNSFSADGAFGNPGNADLAAAADLKNPKLPRNCFYHNRAANGALISFPARIERSRADGPPCDKPGTGKNAGLLAELTCASLGGPCATPHTYYPRRRRTALVALPKLAGMADPCGGVPSNEFCRAKAAGPAHRP
jgi:hypothetical protein